MAEAIFQLSAEINPEVNPASLQRQAADISQKLNAALSKQVAPVQLSISEKIINQVQTVAKKISDGFTSAVKNNETFNKVLAGTQGLIEKTVRGIRTVGVEAQGTFSRLTATIRDLATRGFSTIQTELQKISPRVSSLFTQVKTSAAAAFEQAKIGVTKFTDFLNVTNTKLIVYSGSILGAIRDNSRFKKSFDDLSKSGEFINRLPTSFKTLQAQVLSGTSALQKQAAAGDAISARLVPFLVLGTTIAREIGKIGFVIRQLGADIAVMAANSVPQIDRLNAAFKQLGPEGEQLRQAFNNVGKIAPEVAGKLQQATIDARGQGIDPLNKALLDTRDQVRQLAGVGNIFQRLLDPAASREASAKIKEINAEIFKIKDLRGEVPFFQRIGLQIDAVKDKFKNFSSSAKTNIDEVIVDAREFAQSFSSQQKLFDPGAVSDAKRVEQAVEGVGGAFTRLKDIAKGILGTAFGVQFGKDAANAAQGVQQSLFTPLENAATKAGQQAGDNFSKGFAADAKAGAGDTADSFAQSFGQRFKLGKGTDTGFKGFASGLKAAFTGSERGAASIEALTGGLSKIGGLAGRASGALGGLTGSLKSVASQSGILEGGIANLAGAAGLAGVAAAAIQAAAKMETLKVALSGVFGDAAQEGFKQIVQFASVTPFTVETATNSVIKLGSALKGLTIPGGLAITQQIAGAAAAIGASDDAINRVTLAFSQIAAVGKLTADNIRQITEALPNVSQGAIFENLAKGLGVSTEQAKKFSQDGLVPAKDGLKAIIQALHDVPGAAGALEKQSQTFTGLLSTLKDNATQFLAALGTPLLAVIKPVIKIVSDFLNLLSVGLKQIAQFASDDKEIIKGWLDSFKSGLSAVINAFEPVKSALQFVIDKVGEALSLLKSIPGVSTAINGLAKAFGGAGQQAAQVGPNLQDSLKLALESVDPVARALANLFSKTANPKQFLEAFSAVGDAQKEEAEQANKAASEQIEKTLELKSAFEARDNATKAVTQAQQALTDATQKHNDQIAKESLKLEKDLSEARDKTADATEKQQEAQAKLNELLKGADPEDLEKGDLALAQAKLRLRQLIEDEKKAQEELNSTQRVAVDLGGLSLDQIKSRLSTIRASIAASKAQKKAQAEISPEQADINAAGKVIERRQAELDIVDAEKAVADLRKKGSEQDPEIIAARQAVRDATKETSDAKQRELDIQGEIDKLHGPDLEFQKEIAGLQDGITTAKKAQAQAESDAQLAVAKAKGDSGEILKILEDRINKEPELKKVLEDSNVPIGIAQTLSKDLGLVFRNQVKTEVIDTRSETDKLNDALRTSIDLARQFGIDPTFLILEQAKQAALQKKPIEEKAKAFVNQVLAGDSQIRGAVQEVLFAFLKKSGIENPNAPGAVSKELSDQLSNVGLIAAVQAIQAGNTDIESVKKEIVKALRQIPGFNQVELAKGAIVHGPTQALIGEAGKEAVLPLTNSTRMIKLLSSKHVLPPVLNALERMVIPGAKAPVMEEFKLSPSTPITQPRMVRSASQNKNLQEQSKRDRALAKAIVSEMQEAGLGGGGATVHNSFVQPDANDPLKGLHIRQIAREVKRQIEKEL